MLVGPTALTLIHGDAVIAAKAISDFAREHEVLAYKGGIMDGEALDPEGFKAIARLPGVDVLHGQLVGLTASPLTGLVAGPRHMISGLGSPARARSPSRAWSPARRRPPRRRRRPRSRPPSEEPRRRGGARRSEEAPPTEEEAPAETSPPRRRRGRPTTAEADGSEESFRRRKRDRTGEPSIR